MIFSIIQTAILSVILIALVHYIYIFLKENLTTPKIKDLVNKPMEQYNDIYKDLEFIKEENDNVDMKGELQNYLKTLSAEKVEDKQPVSIQQPDDYSFDNTQGLQFHSL